MPNYCTNASFIVPLNQEQTKFAFDVIDCVQDERIDFNNKRKSVTAKSFKTDVYKIAKKLALSLDYYKPNNVCLDFKIDSHANGVWISHDETINIENAAYFVHLILKYFKLNICVGIQASYTCDESRFDAFGGVAVFVTKKGLKWMSTDEWLQKHTDAFNKRLVA